MERNRYWSITVFGDDQEQDLWLTKLQTQVNNEHHQYTKLLVGGWERSQAGVRHCHVLVEFKNARKMHHIKSLLFLDNIKCFITPKLRNQDIRQIEQHHVKKRSKINDRINFQFPSDYLKLDDEPSIFERGATTDDQATESEAEHKVGTKRKSPASREKNAHILELSEAGDFDTIRRLYPGDWLHNMPKFMAHGKRQKPLEDQTQLEHYWIHGATGTGKTLSVSYLFPDAFTRDPDSKFWDGYVDQEHIILSDLDNRSLRLLGVNKLKTMCDPSGFNMEIKYGGGKLAKAQIIVTSNFTIDDCFKYKGKNANYNQDWYSEIDLIAVKRRFKEVSIHQWLFQNNIRLKSVVAREALIKKGSYKLGDLFETHQLDRTYAPDPTYESMKDLSDKLNQTTQQMAQTGYTNGVAFPKMLFTGCESSTDVQVWRAKDCKLIMTRIPDPEGDGGDTWQGQLAARSPDSEPDEDQDDADDTHSVISIASSKSSEEVPVDPKYRILEITRRLEAGTWRSPDDIAAKDAMDASSKAKKSLFG